MYTADASGRVSAFQVTSTFRVSRRIAEQIRTAGIGKALAAHTEPGKLSVHFRADPSGLVALEKAEAVFETTEEYSVQVGCRALCLPRTATRRARLPSCKSREMA